jgi:hypothetical protein
MSNLAIHRRAKIVKGERNGSQGFNESSRYSEFACGPLSLLILVDEHAVGFCCREMIRGLGPHFSSAGDSLPVNQRHVWDGGNHGTAYRLRNRIGSKTQQIRHVEEG